MAKVGWITTAENYLSRISKDRITEAVTEARGEETATLLSDLKKEKMVIEAERLLSGSGWVPQALRSADAVSSPDTDDDLEAEDAMSTEALPDFLSSAGEEVAGA